MKPELFYANIKKFWFHIIDVPKFSGKEVDGYRLGTQLQEAIKCLQS